MSVKDRIDQALRMAGKTRADLAREMNLERGSVSGMLNKEGDPPIRYLEATSKITGRTVRWILTGSEDTIDQSLGYLNEPSLEYNAKAVADYLKGKHIRPVVATVDASGRELITYVPVKARAGYQRGFGDPEYIETLPAFNLPIMKEGTYRMFQVDGNSMMQLGGGGLHDGDIVIARYVEDVFSIRDNRVYVVVSSDGILIKRCLNRLKTDEHVLICNSDNKSGDYPPIILHPQEILEVWELKAYLSKQLSFATDLWDVIGDLQANQALLQAKVEALQTQQSWTESSKPTSKKKH